MESAAELAGVGAMRRPERPGSAPDSSLLTLVCLPRPEREVFIDLLAGDGLPIGPAEPTRVGGTPFASIGTLFSCSGPLILGSTPDFPARGPDATAAPLDAAAAAAAARDGTPVDPTAVPAVGSRWELESSAVGAGVGAAVVMSVVSPAAVPDAAAAAAASGTAAGDTTDITTAAPTPAPTAELSNSHLLPTAGTAVGSTGVPSLAAAAAAAASSGAAVASGPLAGKSGVLPRISGPEQEKSVPMLAKGVPPTLVGSAGPIGSPSPASRSMKTSLSGLGKHTSVNSELSGALPGLSGRLMAPTPANSAALSMAGNSGLIDPNAAQNLPHGVRSMLRRGTPLSLSQVAAKLQHQDAGGSSSSSVAPPTFLPADNMGAIPGASRVYLLTMLTTTPCCNRHGRMGQAVPERQSAKSLRASLQSFRCHNSTVTSAFLSTCSKSL